MGSTNDYFAKNLRRIRKSKGLTQKELALKISYSEKTVSKWETGGCTPPLQALFAISNALKTDINTLFSANEPKYFLGIDGGGTKTAFALADKDGKIIKTTISKGTNPNDIGIDKAKQILKDGIYETLGGINPSCVVMFAGISGGSAFGFKSEFAEFFKTFSFFDFENDSDNENIIASSLSGKDGITVISGTGICVFAVKGGKKTKFSGYGYLFDNGGSGFNIGRDAICAYFSAKDGFTPHSHLTLKIKEIEDSKNGKFLSQLYALGKEEIASYAKIVFEQAEVGDEVAKSIIKRNMEYASSVINQALKLFESKNVPVILAGGITKNPMALEYIKENLSKEANLSVLDCEPVVGAVKKAISIYEKEII